MRVNASLNHAYDRIINPAMAQGGVANAPILLPLSWVQPTWWNRLLASSRSKMTRSSYLFSRSLIGPDKVVQQARRHLLSNPPVWAALRGGAMRVRA